MTGDFFLIASDFNNQISIINKEKIKIDNFALFPVVHRYLKVFFLL